MLVWMKYLPSLHIASGAELRHTGLVHARPSGAAAGRLGAGALAEERCAAGARVPDDDAWPAGAPDVDDVDGAVDGDVDSGCGGDAAGAPAVAPEADEPPEDDPTGTVTGPFDPGCGERATWATSAVRSGRSALVPTATAATAHAPTTARTATATNGFDRAIRTISEPDPEPRRPRTATR